jgi:penicillin amidase
VILRGVQGAIPMGRAAALLALGVVLAMALGIRQLSQRAALRGAFPQIEGEIAAEGLSGPLEILRDARGVPHLRAASEADALLGLGFVHAQDRLGQMVWLARTAQGRSAELEGASGLPADRLARTLDLAGLAEAQLERLDPETRSALEAYARGVNLHIARIREGSASPPLALRGADLEAWRPADSLAVMKLYAWGLSGTLDASLVLSDLIRELGPFVARRFFPDAGVAVRPVPRVPVTAQSGPTGAEAWSDPLRRALGLQGHAVGSSAWVVGGEHTQSGRPILVADTHLEPTAPNLLHLAHVQGGDLDVAGAAMPGVPVFWTGHNRRVAWASTHARAATTDLYVETLRAGGRRYHDGKGWRPLEERVETIRVRGGNDSVLTVQSTHHGPLVNPLLDPGREPLALAWAGARGSDSGVASLLAVARADDADALVEALASHGEPPLAVVYADADGAAGMQVAGWIPRRAIPTGLDSLPGRARLYDWQGRVPYAALPRARVGKGRGWAIAADNRFTPGDGGEHIEWLWRGGERARRIELLVRSAVRRGPVELRRMVRAQTDLRMTRASELILDALALAGERDRLGAEAREIAALLDTWSGEARDSSVGAAAYHVFLGALTEHLLEHRLGEALLARYLALPQVDPAQLVAELVADAAGGGEPGGWSDASSVAEAVRTSLRETWFRLSYLLGPNRERWSWGRLHPLRFRPFGRRGLEGVGPFPLGGSGTTVAVAEYDPAMPFAVRVAATYRFAIDTSALDEALVSLAPGQSEHPGHAHYADGLSGWLQGRPGLLASSRLQVEESAVARLVLTPES